MKELKPGDINEDGLEIEQDGWITRVEALIEKSDNRLVDETLDTMIKLNGKEVE